MTRPRYRVRSVRAKINFWRGMLLAVFFVDIPEKDWLVEWPLYSGKTGEPIHGRWTVRKRFHHKSDAIGWVYRELYREAERREKARIQEERYEVAIAVSVKDAMVFDEVEV